jgi:hypothetical protein
MDILVTAYSVIGKTTKFMYEKGKEVALGNLTEGWLGQPN